MKKILRSILAIAAIATFSACSNGDYVANPVTNANSSGNPIDALTSSDQFSWSGSGAFSVKLNGVPFSADSSQCSWYLDTGGYNIITAMPSAGHVVTMYFKEVYGNQIYTFGTLNKYNNLRYVIVYDTASGSRAVYSSIYGNIGQVYVSRNDSNGAFLPHIAGKFWFQSLDKPGGTVMNASEGYFDIKKY